MDIDVVVTGDKQASELLSRLSRRLGDGRPQLLSLVNVLLTAEERRFETLGGTSRWKRLSASTLRRHHRSGDRPLILTGSLMRSLTARGAPGQLIEVTPSSLKFGTRVFYARFHQKGKGVPKRTVLGLTRPDRRNLTQQLRRLLLEDL